MPLLKENIQAPNFTLTDQNGEKHTLENYLGKWILLYFYPKDATPGCTTEACEIRDSYAEYKNNDIIVLGISGDSEKSHKKFADKHSLPFTLLADTEKNVIEMYGVLSEKSIFGKTFLGINRVSFLIDPKGKIAKVYPKVKPAEHAKEVLGDVKTL